MRIYIEALRTCTMRVFTGVAKHVAWRTVVHGKEWRQISIAFSTFETSIIGRIKTQLIEMRIVYPIRLQFYSAKFVK
jgi:hypothetical protein